MRDSRSFLEEARRLGRGVGPDLEAAGATVLARSRRVRRRRRRHMAGATMLAGVVAFLLTPAAGGLEGGVSSYLTTARGTAAADVPPGQDFQPSPVETQDPLRGVDSEPSIEIHGAVAAVLPARSSPHPCAPADLTLEVAMDRVGYQPGQPVGLDLVLRNSTSTGCGAPVNTCSTNITIAGAAGEVVYEAAEDHRWLCRSSNGSIALAGGQTVVQHFVWRQVRCNLVASAACGVLPTGPGDYSVTATWGGLQIRAVPRHLRVA